MGFSCKVGAECKFYLLKTDENGEPDCTPLDKGKDVRREICLTLEEMGIEPETSHYEQGLRQNEITFKFGDALTIAYTFVAFKSVVKAIASRNGLFASFMQSLL